MGARKAAVALLASFLLPLGAPGSAGAGVLVDYPGTERNDQISFGYCADCRDGGPGLLICNKARETRKYELPTVAPGNLLIIRGLDGKDTIRAASEETVESCVFGRIIELAGRFRVRIEGGPGSDWLIGTPAADEINGDLGNDRIEGGDGDDNVNGGPGNDLVYGGEGIDEIHGDLGNDKILGGGGDDRLHGEEGDDFIVGGAGNDWILGGSGNDVLMGQAGADSLLGGTGSDIISGGAAQDPLIDGGSGDDTFSCRTGWIQPPYDDFEEAYGDCTTLNFTNVEHFLYRDPYTQWAAVWESSGGYVTSSWTTSSTDLLLTERAAGASLVMESGGDLPVAGDFDGAGAHDLAMFRPLDRRWFFDYGCDGDTDDDVGPWGLPGDRPIAGDFDRDGRGDDVAVFRPATRRWYFDNNHDGSSDPVDPTRPDGPAWGAAGDIPLAGDFDRDGFVDDVAVFRPATRRWFFDHDHNGTTNLRGSAWGDAGDIPLAGDFDRDGKRDDVAVFRPSTARWYYDHDHDGDTDPGTGASVGPWGIEGDIPVAGDFDDDGFADDVAVFRPSTGRWYHDWDHDGDTDPSPGSWFGPWGIGGEPVHTVHKQYGDTCGPSSLAMILKTLALDDPGTRLCVPNDLSVPHEALTCPSIWGDPPPPDVADVGYYGSTEHIMSLGYRREHQEDETWNPGDRFATRDCQAVDACRLIVRTTPHNDDDPPDAIVHDGAFHQIRYDMGDVQWDPGTGMTTGRLQEWLHHAPGLGWGEHEDRGLDWVADLFAATPHAKDLGTTLGERGSFHDLSHLKEVIRSFVDRGIPIVTSVENGGHINALVGYWDTGKDFWLYMADPLDGWGRGYFNKPMRWRKIPLTASALKGRGNAIPGFIFFGHAPEGCATATSWAKAIDRRYERYRVPHLCP